VIPADQAYGANSPGAGIAANDTLVFIVDLVKIN
jgi:FKBP-type peptidyl-prolyl cis-trans isomerase